MNRTKQRNNWYACGLCSDINSFYMITCSYCNVQYHPECVNVTLINRQKPYMCPECDKKLQFLQGQLVYGRTAQFLQMSRLFSDEHKQTHRNQNQRENHQDKIYVASKSAGKDNRNNQSRDSQHSEKISQSTRSSVRRRTQLELERLEEERSLREKEDKEYLDNKYRILMEECRNKTQRTESERQSTDRSSYTRDWLRNQSVEVQPPSLSHHSKMEPTLDGLKSSFERKIDETQFENTSPLERQQRQLIMAHETNQVKDRIVTKPKPTSPEDCEVVKVGKQRVQLDEDKIQTLQDESSGQISVKLSARKMHLDPEELKDRKEKQEIEFLKLQQRSREETLQRMLEQEDKIRQKQNRSRGNKSIGQPTMSADESNIQPRVSNTQTVVPNIYPGHEKMESIQASSNSNAQTETCSHEWLIESSTTVSTSSSWAPSCGSPSKKMRTSKQQDEIVGKSKPTNIHQGVLTTPQVEPNVQASQTTMANVKTSTANQQNLLENHAARKDVTQSQSQEFRIATTARRRGIQSQKENKQSSLVSNKPTQTKDNKHHSSLDNIKSDQRMNELISIKDYNASSNSAPVKNRRRKKHLGELSIDQSPSKESRTEGKSLDRPSSQVHSTSQNLFHDVHWASEAKVNQPTIYELENQIIGNQRRSRRCQNPIISLVDHEIWRKDTVDRYKGSKRIQFGVISPKNQKDPKNDLGTQGNEEVQDVLENNTSFQNAQCEKQGAEGNSSSKSENTSNAPNHRTEIIPEKMNGNASQKFSRPLENQPMLLIVGSDKFKGRELPKMDGTNNQRQDFKLSQRRNHVIMRCEDHSPVHEVQVYTNYDKRMGFDIGKESILRHQGFSKLIQPRIQMKVSSEAFEATNGPGKSSTIMRSQHIMHLLANDFSLQRPVHGTNDGTNVAYEVNAGSKYRMKINCERIPEMSRRTKLILIAARLPMWIGSGNFRKSNHRTMKLEAGNIWINLNYRKYSQFVAHRVGDFIKRLDVNEWPQWISKSSKIGIGWSVSGPKDYSTNKGHGMLNRLTRKKDGKDETGLLWENDDEINLPDSYPMALKRLVGLERQGAKMVQNLESLMIRHQLSKMKNHPNFTKKRTRTKYGSELISLNETNRSANVYDHAKIEWNIEHGNRVKFKKVMVSIQKPQIEPAYQIHGLWNSHNPVAIQNIREWSTLKVENVNVNGALKVWTSCICEVVNQLTKWYKQVVPSKHLVLTAGGKGPRNTYPKARILETETGSNGQVRRAKVEIISSTRTSPEGKICKVNKIGLWRSAHKLAVLDVAKKNGLADGNRETGGSVATNIKSNVGASISRAIEIDLAGSSNLPMTSSERIVKLTEERREKV